MVVTKLLDQLNLASMLTGPRAGWSFDAITGEVVCSDGRQLGLTSVRKPGHSPHTGIIFRRPKGGCQECPDRAGCLQSHRAEASKHVQFSVDAKIAEALRVRLARIRGKSDAARTHLGEVDGAPGPRAVRDALFLPARARQLHRALFDGATLWVEVDRPRSRPTIALVAEDTGDRQRRRKTWAQNIARYALPESASVTVEVACHDKLRAWLRGQPSGIPIVGGTV